MSKCFVKFFFNLPSVLAIKLISFYQRTISPDHGFLRSKYPQGYCKYKPTCSDYSKQAFGKYGFFRGFLLSFWRILRCNPWSKGGEDGLR
uniref:Putative membrane protein insertion efficiency factor n=1 Tax=candidate division CPR3 bacterium TaxID=2268181 RepID=A0A7C4M0N9_UNCC3